MSNGTLGNYDLRDGGARNVSGFVTARALSSGAENMAIPTVGTTGATSRAKRVILTCTAAICISFTGTAVVPADDDTGVKSPLVMPSTPVESRTFIIPADTSITNLSVIASDSGTALVTAEWFY